MKLTFRPKIKGDMKTLFKYFCSILFRNKIILFILTLNFILAFVIPLLVLVNCNDINSKYYNVALIIISAPSILSILFICSCSIILFSKTKQNNVDIFLYTKHYQNKHIVLMKQLAIFVLSTSIIIGNFISLILTSALGVNVSKVISIFVITLFSILLNNLFWIFVLTFISIYLKPISGMIASIVFSIGSIIIAVLPILSYETSEINIGGDFSKYKQNIIKVYDVDNNGHVKRTSLALYENPLAPINNKIKNSKIKTMYNPFNFVFGLAPTMSSNLIGNGLNLINLYSVNGKYSINSEKIKTTDFSEINDYQNVIISPARNKTIFDYKSRSAIFADIDKDLNNFDIIKNKLRDSNYWEILLNEIKTRKIWKSNLDETREDIIIHFSGLDSSDSIYYDLFKNYELVKNKIEDIYKYFSFKYNKYLAEFMKYIWTNSNVKTNIYAYKSISKSKIDDVEKYHPSIMRYHPLGKANKFDIKYIKNKFFNFPTVGTLQVLREGGHEYKTINNVHEIFSRDIKNQKELDEYIDSNDTINNLINLNNKIERIEKIKTYPIEYRDNVKNSLIINNKYSFEHNSKYSWNFLFVILFGFVAAALEKLTINKVEKGDIL